MRATVHIEGCPTLDLARRQVDNPPPRVQRPAVIEEARYRRQAAIHPMADPAEHAACCHKKGPEHEQERTDRTIPLEFAC